MLGLLAITAIPTTIGVSTAVNEQRKENEREDDQSRMSKFNIVAACDGEDGDEEDDDDDDGSGGNHGRSRSTGRRLRMRREVEGKWVVLRDGKVWLDEHNHRLRVRPAYTAQCFYIQYPDEEREKTLGLVSRISDDPPQLNWLYLDKNTFELKYGNRTQSREHHVGPWDWTDPEDGEPHDEHGNRISEKGGDRLTLEGWEGFVAVEEEAGSGDFSIYFDRDDDGFKGKRELRGKRRMEISLERLMCDVEDDSVK